MRPKNILINYSVMCIGSILLAACGGGNGNEAANHNISGSVSGLTGSVVLKDSNGQNLTVSTNGNFTIATSVPDGSTYSIIVLAQPTGQTCTVSAGAGIVKGKDITDVAVTCVANPQEVGYEQLELAKGFWMPVPSSVTGAEPGHYEIRNATDWAALWSTQYSYILPPPQLPPPPEVDFSSRMIIGVVKKTYGCDGIGITNIFELGGELVVEYQFGPPSRPLICATVMDVEAHFVTVPQSQLPVRFVGIAN